MRHHSPLLSQLEALECLGNQDLAKHSSTHVHITDCEDKMVVEQPEMSRLPSDVRSHLEHSDSGKSGAKPAVRGEMGHFVASK